MRDQFQFLPVCVITFLLFNTRQPPKKEGGKNGDDILKLCWSLSCRCLISLLAVCMVATGHNKLSPTVWILLLTPCVFSPSLSFCPCRLCYVTAPAKRHFVAAHALAFFYQLFTVVLTCNCIYTKARTHFISYWEQRKKTNVKCLNTVSLKILPIRKVIA